MPIVPALLISTDGMNVFPPFTPGTALPLVAVMELVLMSYHLAVTPL